MMKGGIPMLGTVISAVTAFAATNVDDIFMLMLFFAQEEQKRQWKTIVMGQYLGVSLLILVSFLGALAARTLPETLLAVLGLIPIALGVREWYNSRKHGKADEAAIDCPEEGYGEGMLPSRMKAAGVSRLLTVALVALANGADNVGVYIPLLATSSPVEAGVTVLVFLGMVALWCVLGQYLARLPLFRRWILKHKSIVVPLVLVGLGVYVILACLL